MRVVEIWRYPVKSLLGERLPVAHVGARGLTGDRHFAIFDLTTGLGLTARRAPELLQASARWVPGGGVQITAADGTVLGGDDELSALVGRPVALRSCEEVETRRYEGVRDFEDEDRGGWDLWEGAASTFHDDPSANVSLVSTTTLGAWDRRRFRANVVLGGAGEEDLVGSRIALGGAVLDVGIRIARCVMVTRPQAPGGGGDELDRDLDVLRTIHRERGGSLAVGATVSRPGPIRVGDELRQSAPV